MSAPDIFSLGGRAAADLRADDGRARPHDEIISAITAPSDDAVMAMVRDLRLVVRTLSCTHDQLSEEFACVDPRDIELLLDQWKKSAARLRALADVVDEAVARWLSASRYCDRDHG